MRNYFLDLCQTVLAILVALVFYTCWGGVFPLPGLSWPAVLPAVGTILCWIFFSRLFWLPVILMGRQTITPRADASVWSGIIRVFSFFLLQGVAVVPFAILAAGLYAGNGLWGYLFFVVTMLLAALLGHYLSRAADRDRQRSQEVGQLERLGRAIIDAPPDASTLPNLLQEHIPPLFAPGQGEIRIFPDQVLLSYPEGRPGVNERAWAWLQAARAARTFMPGEELPWGGRQPAGQVLLIAPIAAAGEQQMGGGIHIVPSSLPAQSPRQVVDRLVAVQTLADQVTSALSRARIYARTLAHQKVEQELALAWEIQSSLLPEELPHFPGWSFTASLQPARQTSGDYYDLISLPDGRCGIVIADVAGKGMGAALYMALSRTLLRTYTLRDDPAPAWVVETVNQRLLVDSQVDMFVTVFVGILDPDTGRLTYANAGHSPPYLFRAGDSPAEALVATGPPLGMLDDVAWEQKTVQIAPGDLLVLYTDGITAAEDGREGFFGSARLLEAVQGSHGAPVEEVARTLLAAVERFQGGYPQQDDVTLLLVAAK